MTLGTIAAAMGGRITDEHAGREVGGFSIDTRTLRPGDVFFAIRGDRFDGHAFVADALKAGAAAAVVSAEAISAVVMSSVAQGFSLVAGQGAPLIVVTDTLAS